MEKQTAIIYWLIPAPKYRELFIELIRILARQFDAPQFEPHLTLCRANDEQAVAKTLRQIKGEPFRLRVRQISYSSKFTKTLFVRFSSNASLDRLVLKLGGKSRSPRDPHISLLYKRLPAGIKRQVAATIRLPFREVLFDGVKAVHCPVPTETRVEVKRWRVVAIKRLSG
jgi:hypothetical protein